MAPKSNGSYDRARSTAGLLTGRYRYRLFSWKQPAFFM